MRGYGSVLSGQADPLSILYPDGDGGMIRALEASQARFSNLGALQTLLAQLAARIAGQAPGRRLRVLEVGAGEGNLTWRVAAALQPYDVDYYVTDVARSLVLHAEQQAAQQGFDVLRFGVLNITQDPGEHGLADEQFDLVLASQVVHATPALETTLHNLRGLLAPGGILGIIEATHAERWATLVWGLLDLWWHYTDERPYTRSPLLGFRQWEELAARQGFRQVAVYPAPGGSRARAHYGLLLLQEHDRLPDERLVAARQLALDTRRRKIRQIQALEALGATVKVLVAAPDDPVQLGAAVEQARREHGPIAGVVCADSAAQAEPPTRPALLRRLQAVRDRLAALEQTLGDTPPAQALLVAAGPARWEDGSLPARAAFDYQAGLAALERRGGGLPWVSVEWQIAATATSEAVQAALRALFAADADAILLIDQAVPPIWNHPTPPPAAEQRPAAARLHPRPAGLGPYAPPEDATQRALARIWQDVLGIDQIGIHDDFLQVGGNSLQATQLLSRIRQAFPIRLELRQFFTAPTVAGVAALLAESQAEEAGDLDQIVGLVQNMAPDEIMAELQRLQQAHD